MRVTTAVVAGCSFVATAATIANAFFINRQFYPSVVYITKSNASMAVIYFQIVMVVYMFFQLMKKIFFGELRQAETEHLWERTWHAILETCLAFTVFRDDFSPMFVMNFGLLLFVKCFHWLAEDRVDIMERSPVIPLRFHARILSLMAFLASINSYLISHAYFSIMTKGPSSQLVFGFEYAILMTLLIHIAVKYILHMHDLQTGGVWEAKQVYLLYTELITSFVRCVLYGMFAILMIRLHTFPLFFIRPFYLSLRSLHKAINDVILSRRAITAMNTMFPVVTAEELANMDATCIICREEMTHESQPKKLPCSHVFHAHCLRSWFQRQQTCPTCRTDILGRNNPNREARVQPAPAAAAAAGGVGAAPQVQGPIFAFAAHQFAAAPFQQPPNPATGNGPSPNPPAGWNLQQNNGFANPFPGLPFMPPMGLMPPLPPPMPPMPSLPRPALHELSDEELRTLEGTSRDAVISRIRMLQDVSSLLDAVDMMMRQYCLVSGFPEFPAMNPQSAPPSPSSTAATQSTSVTSSPSQPAAEPSSEVETPTTSQPSEETATTSSSSPSRDISQGSPGSSSEEQNIVRELRRRRFEQQQQQQQQENGST